MSSKKRLLYLILVIVLSVIVFVVTARVLPDMEVNSRQAYLFEKPDTLPAGLFSVQPEPGSSGQCNSWEREDRVPVVCHIRICWKVDDLFKSKGKTLYTSLVVLLNGESLEGLDPNQSISVELTTEGTGSAEGADHIESSISKTCRNIQLAPGDYLVTLSTSTDSSQPVYEWAFKITGP